MNQKTIRVALVALFFLAVIPLTYFVFHDEYKEELSIAAETKLTESQSLLINESVALQTSTKQDLPQSSKDTEVERDISENPFFEAETKARLIQITQDFAEDIQYPDYAKPIRNKDELHKYLPNVSVESSLPLDENQLEDGPNISIKASKLQYFRGEAIVADVVISGLADLNNISVQARLVDSGNLLTEVDAFQQAASDSAYRIVFQAEDIPQINSLGVLRLIASFQVNGRHYELGTPVQYLESIASVDYVADAMVNDTFLEIPVYITTYQPGYHQISANLYDAKSGSPLVHLTAEKELLVEKDFILLKSHIVSLKASGSEGPYILKDFVLTRMPSAPRFMTEYGEVPKDYSAVSGYSFDEYTDEPYEDAQAKERLDYLSKLGGGA